MPRRTGPASRDVMAIAAVLALWAVAVAGRHWFVEPHAWGAICAPDGPGPFACAPREALLWAQHHGLLGAAALGLGLAALLVPRFALAVAAVAAGVFAAHNFNPSFGVLGAALGAWSWVRLPRASKRWAA